MRRALHRRAGGEPAGRRDRAALHADGARVARRGPAARRAQIPPRAAQAHRGGVLEVWLRRSRAKLHTGRVTPPCPAVVSRPTCLVMCRRCYFSRVAQIKIELCNDFSTCNQARRAASRSAARFAIDEGDSAGSCAEPPGPGSCAEPPGSGAEPPHSDSQNMMVQSELACESPPPFRGGPSDLAELDREFEALVGGHATQGEST